MPRTKDRIQVYGRFDGQWSHSQVSRGLVQGLRANGLSLNVWNAWGCNALLDRNAVLYEDMPDDTAVDHEPSAEIGLWIGGYPPMLRGALDRHRFKIAMFVTESEVIPHEWNKIAATCDLVLVPSHWAKCAYVQDGVRVLVVPHAANDIYHQPRQVWPNDNRLVFGHVAGAASFLDRKGTPQLVEAFANTFKPEEAVLKIRTPMTPEAAKLKIAKHIKLEWSDLGHQLTQEQMQAWYWSLHYLVQPSRAEAFGMCPVEANACGVPVILTNGSGHTEHAEKTRNIMIPVHASGPIRVNGIPNGIAPTIRVTDIENALTTAAQAAHTYKTKHRQTLPSGRMTWQKATGGLTRILNRGQLKK